MKIKKTRKTSSSKKKDGNQNPSQFRSVSEVCDPDMIAFHFWREWHQARNRNDYAFMYDMTRKGSPLREQINPEEKFADACRRREGYIPGLREGTLRKISLQGPDIAHMFEIIEPRSYGRHKPVNIRRWFMLRDEEGWRLEAVDDQKAKQPEIEDMLNISAFPERKAPEGFVGRSEATS